MAKTEKNPKGAGRKHILLDKEQVEKLAAMWCTMKEMASFFNCSVDTLERNYADIIDIGRDKGKIKLRRLQWQSAEKGNVRMQIHLGEQLLEQRRHLHLATDQNINVSNEGTDELANRLGELFASISQRRSKSV